MPEMRESLVNNWGGGRHQANFHVSAAPAKIAQRLGQRVDHVVMRAGGESQASSF